jgi:hypothetical protein
VAAFYFLPEDFTALNARIAELTAVLREIGEMGKSCQEGAETFHDNFAYEDGERQQRMWSRLRQELVRIRDRARVVCPGARPRRLGSARSCWSATRRARSTATGSGATWSSTASGRSPMTARAPARGGARR